jgi:hypothetical protein
MRPTYNEPFPVEQGARLCWMPLRTRRCRAAVALTWCPRIRRNVGPSGTHASEPSARQGNIAPLRRGAAALLPPT